MSKKPQAVFLDQSTTGDDAPLDAIQALTNLKLYKSTKPEQTAERIGNAEIVITNKVVIDEDVMRKCPNIKLICVAATGYNNIDIQAARKKNITVANVKGYSTESVAQTVFGFLLAIMNSTLEYNRLTKDGKWQASPVFTMLDFPFREIKDKKFGIIGYGTIGKRVAEIAKAFGAEVLIANRPGKQYTDGNRTDWETFLKTADIISIHTPLSKETENLISAKELGLMKPSAILINTARGGIVNEKELYQALVHKRIAHAATDVLSQEPPTYGNPLLGAPNIFISPHIAWTSVESRKRLIAGIAENIRLYHNGEKEKIAL